VVKQIAAADGGGDGGITIASAASLLATADALPCVPPSLDRLPPALEAHAVLLKSVSTARAAAAAWLAVPTDAAATSAAAAEAALCHGAEAATTTTTAPTAASSKDTAAKVAQARPALSHVVELITAADSSRMRCEGVSELRSLLSAPQEAIVSVRKALNKRGGTLKTDQCIAIVAGSTRSASAALSRAFAPPDAAAVAPELNCICQQVYHEGQQMVACDTCEGWYHLRCCSVSASAARSLSTWECPVCAATSGDQNPEPLLALAARVHRTRAAPLSELHASLRQLQACAAQLPEEAALAAALADADAWEQRVRRALAEPAGSPTSPAANAWADAVRQALALEAGAAELLPALLERLRLERWCSAVAALLRRSSSGSSEVAAGGIEELRLQLAAAAKVPGAADTTLYRDAVALADTSATLTSQTTALLANVRAKRQTLKSDLAALRKARIELEALPVRPAKLLDVVVHVCTTHCLCGVEIQGSMAGEDGVMACNSCGTHLHLACVGIPKEKEPKHLECPLCSGRAGRAFVWGVRSLLAPSRLDSPEMSSWFPPIHACPESNVCGDTGRRKYALEHPIKPVQVTACFKR
jgi:hypothetical protein